MTQLPQPNVEPQEPQTSDAKRPAFSPILPEPAPTPSSRKGLIVLGAATVLVVVGLVFCGGGPDEAEAQDAEPDYKALSAEQLAKDAGPAAARELARRIIRGTGPDQAEASSVLNHWPSPRLARNFAMAMAVETRKKQNERMIQMRRDQQMVEYGPHGR